MWLNLNSVPAWLGTAVIGLTAAALSYAGKILAEAFQSRRHSRDEKRARLFRLSSLLGASKVAFEIQNELARRLWSMLVEKYRGREAAKEGFESQFTRLYDEFTAEEAELHGIIRGITIYAMRPANQAISKWLEEDVDFRTESWKHTDLAAKLNLLASHLMLWHAKFEAWIPDNPKHALVYMADEADHGLGFPQGVDGLVLRALREIGCPPLRRWLGR